MNRTLLLFLLILGSLTFVSYKAVIIIDNKMNPLPIYGDENHSVPSFVFTNQLDQEFKSELHNEKIWVVNYFFTSCPSICPKMMKNIQEVHDIVRSNSDIILLSFTVDPKRDTPERFSSYLDNYNVDHSTWQLLTGDKKDLYRLARKSFLISATDGGGDEDDFIHSENIVILDKNKKVRSIINGIAPDADREILKVISRIKKES